MAVVTPEHRCRFDSPSLSVLAEERHRLGRAEERRMCIECHRMSDWRRAKAQAAPVDPMAEVI